MRKPTVVPFQGRIYVILVEVDGHSAIPHGVVACPARITDHRVALDEIRNLHRQVTEQRADAWNYGDFLAALEAHGYAVIDAAYWVE